MATSRFPKDIYFFCLDAEPTLHGSDTVDVRKTYVAYKASRSRILSGKTAFDYYDYPKRKRVEFNPVEIRCPNEFTRLRIVDGSKAILEDQFLVDIGADLLADCINHADIEDGIITGEFVYGVNGNDFSLHMVGGKNHAELVRQENLNKSYEAEKVSKFVYGHFYESSGLANVYLGTVMIPSIYYDMGAWRIEQPAVYTKHHMWLALPEFVNGKLKEFSYQDLKFTKKSELVPLPQQVTLPNQHVLIQHMKEVGKEKGNDYRFTPENHFLLHSIRPRTDKIKAFLKAHTDAD